MGAVLESTRFAERELSRGELVELGPGIFLPTTVKTHFLSFRFNTKNSKKINQIKNLINYSNAPIPRKARYRLFIKREWILELLLKVTIKIQNPCHC